MLAVSASANAVSGGTAPPTAAMCRSSVPAIEGFLLRKALGAVKDKKIFPGELPGLRTGLVQQPVQIVARFAITI
jgi:hypothetical protein